MEIGELQYAEVVLGCERLSGWPPDRMPEYVVIDRRGSKRRGSINTPSGNVRLPAEVLAGKRREQSGPSLLHQELVARSGGATCYGTWIEVLVHLVQVGGVPARVGFGF